MSAAETRSGKRKPRQANLLALTTLDKVSKDALADLVIDLLRRCAGREDLDGIDLCEEFCEAFKPIAQVRGDRMPNPRKIQAKLDAAIARRELYRHHDEKALRRADR